MLAAGKRHKKISLVIATVIGGSTAFALEHLIVALKLGSEDEETSRE